MSKKYLAAVLVLLLLLAGAGCSADPEISEPEIYKWQTPISMPAVSSSYMDYKSNLEWRSRKFGPENNIHFFAKPIRIESWNLWDFYELLISEFFSIPGGEAFCAGYDQRLSLPMGDRKFGYDIVMVGINSDKPKGHYSKSYTPFSPDDFGDLGRDADYVAFLQVFLFYSGPSRQYCEVFAVNNSQKEFVYTFEDLSELLADHYAYTHIADSLPRDAAYEWTFRYNLFGYRPLVKKKPVNPELTVYCLKSDDVNKYKINYLYSASRKYQCLAVASADKVLFDMRLSRLEEDGANLFVESIRRAEINADGLLEIEIRYRKIDDYYCNVYAGYVINLKSGEIVERLDRVTVPSSSQHWFVDGEPVWIVNDGDEGKTFLNYKGERRHIWDYIRPEPSGCIPSPNLNTHFFRQPIGDGFIYELRTPREDSPDIDFSYYYYDLRTGESSFIDFKKLVNTEEDIKINIGAQTEENSLILSIQRTDEEGFRYSSRCMLTFVREPEMSFSCYYIDVSADLGETPDHTENLRLYSNAKQSYLVIRYYFEREDGRQKGAAFYSGDGTYITRIDMPPDSSEDCCDVPWGLLDLCDDGSFYYDEDLTDRETGLTPANADTFTHFFRLVD